MPVVSGLDVPDKGGLSSDTLLADLSWTSGGQRHDRRVAVRLPPPADAWPVFPTYDLGRQAVAMEAVRRGTSVPVPEVLWYEPDPAPLGDPFIVMDRVDGIAAPDYLPYTWGSWVTELTRDQRAVVADTCIDVIAAIHGADVTPAIADVLELHRTSTGRPSDDTSRANGRATNGRATIVTSPPSSADSKCSKPVGPHTSGTHGIGWGDARLGNVLWSGTDPVAVLDWEMVALTPPELDLSWMVFFAEYFQRSAERRGLPGIPDFLTRETAVARYERVTGASVEHFDWYLCYTAVREAIVSLRTMGRAVHFGELSAPEDPEALILDRDFVVELTDAARTHLITREDPWNTRSVNSSPPTRGSATRSPTRSPTSGRAIPSWTEKVCAMAAAQRRQRSSSASASGKYTNRNVIDAYAGGLARRRAVDGAGQPPPRARPGAHRRRADPLRGARAAAASSGSRSTPTTCSPSRSSGRSRPRCRRRSRTAPHTRDRLPHVGGPRALPPDRRRLGLGRDRRRARPSSTPTRWVSTRDHSWGVRYGVGVPPPDRPEPSTRSPGLGVPDDLVPDAVRARRRHALRDAPPLPDRHRAGLGIVHKIVMGGVEHPDGRVRAVARPRRPSSRYDPANRRLRGGVVRATTGRRRRPASSTSRSLDDTGFHLGAGLYFGFDGHHHGEWRGELHVDGEHIADCTDARDARAACTRSATPSSASPTRSAAASGSATASRSSPARAPTSASTPSPRSSDRASCDACPGRCGRRLRPQAGRTCSGSGHTSPPQAHRAARWRSRPRSARSSNSDDQPTRDRNRLRRHRQHRPSCRRRAARRGQTVTTYARKRSKLTTWTTRRFGPVRHRSLPITGQNRKSARAQSSASPVPDRAVQAHLRIHLRNGWRSARTGGDSVGLRCWTAASDLRFRVE